MNNSKFLEGKFALQNRHCGLDKEYSRQGTCTVCGPLWTNPGHCMNLTPPENTISVPQKNKQKRKALQLFPFHFPLYFWLSQSSFSTPTLLPWTHLLRVNRSFRWLKTSVTRYKQSAPGHWPRFKLVHRGSKCT